LWAVGRDRTRPRPVHAGSRLGPTQPAAGLLQHQEDSMGKFRITVGTLLTSALALSTAAMVAAQPEIAFVPPGMVSPFYSGVISGAKPAAGKLGYKFVVVAPERESDFAGQAKIVEDMVENGVSGIALCAINIEAIASSVKKANEAKIPVVVFNSLTDLPSGNVFAYVGYDQRAGGAKVADYVNKIKHGKAKVAIIEGLPSSFTTERKGGFVDELKKFPGIKVVASQPGDWEREKSMNVAQNILESNPDVDVFYGLSDEMALGASQACKAANKKGVAIIGIDGNPNAVDAVAKGDLTATLGTNPDLMGAKAIEVLNLAVKGKTSGKKVITDTTVIDKSNCAKFAQK
jgi:ribose transport system substrate-binding protein